MKREESCRPAVRRKLGMPGMAGLAHIPHCNAALVLFRQQHSIPPTPPTITGLFLPSPFPHHDYLAPHQPPRAYMCFSFPLLKKSPVGKVKKKKTSLRLAFIYANNNDRGPYYLHPSHLDADYTRLTAFHHCVLLSSQTRVHCGPYMHVLTFQTILITRRSASCSYNRSGVNQIWFSFVLSLESDAVL